MKTLLLSALVALLLLANVSAYSGAAFTADEEVSLRKSLVEEHSKFLATGEKSPQYNEIIEKLRFQSPEEFRQVMQRKEVPQKRQTPICGLCRILIGAIIDQMRNQGFTEAQVREEYADLCVALNLFTRPVCEGFASIYVSSLYYILENRFTLDEATICGVVLQQEECIFENNLFNFTATVSPGGTPITGSKGPSANPGTNTLKIVHFSELHFDPNYSPGANAVCGEPLCCGISQSTPSVLNPENAAGYWGDYRDCDLPWQTVDDILEHIRRTHPDADMIYYTGDIVNHRIWQSSVRGHVTLLNRVYGDIRNKFQGIPFFPILGSHEANPKNIFAPLYLGRRDLSSEWVYDYHADAWASFLPESARETVLNGGYYSILVRPGLRLIALNSNECFTLNYWMLYDPSYLMIQLNWLNDELFAAEQAGEKVHILSHLTGSGGNCLNAWTREYRRIVDRYWDTISAQFNGHTHGDEFNVFYDLENPDFAVNVAFNGGSVSPFSSVNPNYIVYTVDDNNYEVQTRHSTYTNLTEANLSGLRHPIWEQLYDFVEDWGVANMSPAELDALVYRFAASRQELTTYWQLKVKLGDPALAAGCDTQCLILNLCAIVTTEFDDHDKCDELTAIFLSSS